MKVYLSRYLVSSQHAQTSASTILRESGLQVQAAIILSLGDSMNPVSRLVSHVAVQCPSGLRYPHVQAVSRGPQVR